MAQLPVQPILQVEDVPAEQRTWMSKLIRPLNQFVSETINVLNKKLTFQENFLAQVKSIQFKNTANAFPLYFNCTLGQRPIGVVKFNCIGLKTTTPIDILDWEYTQGQQVQINSISGLTADESYTITVLVV